MADYSQYFPTGSEKATDYSQYFPPAPTPPPPAAVAPQPAIPSFGQRIGNAALSGSLRGGLIPGFAAGLGELSNIAEEKYHKFAYDVGGAVTDIGSLAGAPPEIAASAGYLTNMAYQGLPIAASFGGILGQPARQLPQMFKSIQPEMAGMGAANTAVDALRAERAAQMPVPIQLTKGQATRSFEQQQFEREAAKNPTIGEPLRARFAEQNRQIQQNLEFFADQTGMESGTLRGTGQLVTDAIAAKAKARKGQIDAAYTAARQSGELQEPVNIAPLTAYLEAKAPQSINAGVISSTLADVQATSKKTGGVISINDLEEIRKGVGIAGGKDATNAHFAREIKGIIDNLTEGVGGEKYKAARGLRAKYADEFENIGIIDRLLSYKPGTKDRAIAYEDVFDRSMLGGSLDDVKQLRRTLQTAGPNGERAWKDLQGQTITHIRDEITKNAQRDINGNPIVSPAQFNKVVNGLDKDGKLDFIFGKQGAQKVRDLRDISLDSMTSPPGSVNTSNTAAVVMAALDTIVSGASGLPLPIGSAINYGIKKAGDVRLKRRVSDALKP